MARVLITGGAGFLGSTLARRLVTEDWDVTVIDRVARADARRLDGVKLAGYLWQDLNSVRRLEWPYVVHCAAVADVPYAHVSPFDAIDANIRATANLCEAAAVCDGFARLVVMSSESVYGRVDVVPIPETTPLNPTSIYGATKAGQELMARSYIEAKGLPVTIIRSGTMFGPTMRLSQIISIFLAKAIRDEEIPVDGDGAQTRDFNTVDNLVDGLLLALATPAAAGEVFNVAGGREVSVKEVAEIALAVTGSQGRIVHRPQRPGEQGLRLVPDITKARAVLGYTPRISFEEGMARTAAWLQGVIRPERALAAR